MINIPQQQSQPIILLPEVEWTNSYQNHLLKWYSKNKRDLPWRSTHDPYRIWISEVMLQQTQVDTVIPYYQRFIAKYSDVKKLARASQTHVLKLWEGLGYYTRARNLLAAAKIIISDFNGEFPRDYMQMRALPGIGPYIAAAVLSIAFNLDYAVVDGNVVRVICRLLNITKNPHSSNYKKAIAATATRLLAKGNAGEYNQAVMELGAMICITHLPKCQICPSKFLCLAFNLGNPENLPVKPPKKEKPHYDIAVGLIWRGKKILIAQRPSTGLLGGLWELPGGKKEANESLEVTVKREIKEELGIEVRVKDHFMTIRHAYTHFRITMHAYHCEYISGQPRAIGCENWRWVKPEELRLYPFPKANLKLFERLWQECDTP